MTREIAETITNVDRPIPVVNLEDGQVWISGMNARPWVLARAIETELEAAGIEHGEPTDDEATEFGGLVIPVSACEEISDAVHTEVFDGAEA